MILTDSSLLPRMDFEQFGEVKLGCYMMEIKGDEGTLSHYYLGRAEDLCYC